MATPPFDVGKPFVRQPQGDARATLVDKRREVAHRAAEVAGRRAIFDATNSNWGAAFLHWQPCMLRARHTDANPLKIQVVHGAGMKRCPKIKAPQSTS